MDKKIQIRINRNGMQEQGRLARNASSDRFDLSKDGSVLHATVDDIFFDGESGDLVANAHVEKSVTREMRRNPDFTPKSANAEDVPALFKKIEDRERDMYGKSFSEMSVDELLANEEFVRGLMKEARPIKELF